jgi:ATP-dependent Clp protease adapter protein ClpS
VGPDIYNSAYEVSRYLRTSGKIHDGIVNVFWDIPGESLQSLVEVGDFLSVESLRTEGVTDISVSNLEIGGRKAIRLDHVYKLGDIDDWASRSYFMQIRRNFVCLNMGTSDRASDCALYDQIANSFNAIEDSVGIVLVRDDETPATFVVEVLEMTFRYPHRKALQRSVRMNTQHESVVALVEEGDAPRIIESVAEQSRKAGYGLTARVVGEPQ